VKTTHSGTRRQTHTQGLWIETRESGVSEWFVQAWPPRARRDSWFTLHAPPSVKIRVREGEVVRVIQLPGPLDPPQDSLTMSLRIGRVIRSTRMSIKLLLRATKVGRTVPQGALPERAPGSRLVKYVPHRTGVMAAEVRGAPDHPIDESDREGQATDVEAVFD
jgi:hypothetical protein